MKTRRFTLLLLLAALPMAAQSDPATRCTSDGKSSQNIHMTDDDGRKTWKVLWTGDNCSVDLRAEGDVKFASDGVSVESISPGGYLEVTERLGNDTRRLRVSSPGGQVKYEFWTNGATTPFDQQGKVWLAQFLISLDRQTGMLVEARLPALLRQGGPNAVLEEINHIKSDYARRRYFRGLLETAKLDAPTLTRAVKQAGEQVKSDYELAGILIAVATDYALADDSRAAFVGAIGSIESDYEHARVLLALVQRHNLSAADVQFVLAGLENMRSDYERARVLMQLTSKDLVTSETQQAYVQAIDRMRSDYERARSLLALIHTGKPAPRMAQMVLEATTKMRSDYERVRVMLALASAGLDHETRATYVRTAEQIRSTYERERALRAVGVTYRETSL